MFSISFAAYLCIYETIYWLFIWISAMHCILKTNKCESISSKCLWFIISALVVLLWCTRVEMWPPILFNSDPMTYIHGNFACFYLGVWYIPSLRWTCELTGKVPDHTFYYKQWETRLEIKSTHFPLPQLISVSSVHHFYPPKPRRDAHCTDLEHVPLSMHVLLLHHAVLLGQNNTMTHTHVGISPEQD